MERCVNTSYTHYVLCGIYGLSALSVPALLSGGDGAVMAVITVAMLGVAVLHFCIARSADRAKPWARNASLLIGILMVASFLVNLSAGIMAVASPMALGWFILGASLILNSWRAWEPPETYSRSSLADAWPDSRRGKDGRD